MFLLYLNCFICLFIMDKCNSWIRKHLLTSSLLPVPIFLPLNFTNLLDGFLLNSHLLGLPINQTGSASGFFPGVVIFHQCGYWFVRQLRVKAIQNQWLAFLVLNHKNDNSIQSYHRTNQGKEIHVPINAKFPLLHITLKNSQLYMQDHIAFTLTICWILLKLLPWELYACSNRILSSMLHSSG